MRGPFFGSLLLSEAHIDTVIDMKNHTIGTTTSYFCRRRSNERLPFCSLDANVLFSDYLLRCCLSIFHYKGHFFGSGHPRYFNCGEIYLGQHNILNRPP